MKEYEKVEIPEMRNKFSELKEKSQKNFMDLEASMQIHMARSKEMYEEMEQENKHLVQENQYLNTRIATVENKNFIFKNFMQSFLKSSEEAMKSFFQYKKSFPQDPFIFRNQEKYY